MHPLIEDRFHLGRLVSRIILFNLDRRALEGAEVEQLAFKRQFPGVFILFKMDGCFGDLLPEMKCSKNLTEIVLRPCHGYALRAGLSACLEEQPVIHESGKWFSAAKDAGCADRVLSRAGHGLVEEPEQKVLTYPEV